jgi:hypothetical protein
LPLFGIFLRFEPQLITWDKDNSLIFNTMV